MCGITALVRSGSSTIRTQDIKEMTRLLRHRGPDDEGYLLISSNLSSTLPFSGFDTCKKDSSSSLNHLPTEKTNTSAVGYPEEQIEVLLGHRRLAVTDLAIGAHQPMALEDHPVWITYNGEVFNHAEIRQELQALGYSFKTHSDTEVILRAYLHWGQACLHKFNGMFAFVIIDLQHKKLFAARDRFGVKPFYFWKSPNGTLAIASEIKAFTTLSEWQPEVNIGAAFQYLAYGLTDYCDETLFKDVRQLRGGQYIECDLPLKKDPEPKFWYYLKKHSYNSSFSEASNDYYDLFEDAVRIRLKTEVPVGACLSGGLDSSSIVCMAKKILKTSPKTFSSCSKIPKYDERRYMEEVIEQTNADATFVYPTVEKLCEMIKELTWIHDEPFGSTSIFAQYLVFEQAKVSGIKVLLDGQGADEKLAGYTPYWNAHLLQILKKGQLLHFFHEASVAKHQKPTFLSLGSFLLKSIISARMKHAVNKIFKPRQSPLNWINKEFITQTELQRDFKDTHDSKLIHHVDRLSYQQLMFTSLPALLRYEDRNSMAHSIESRTPFLDYRLVEFIFSLPANYKISDGYTKKILRSALQGTLPESIRLRRDKLGFATAEEVWMLKEKPAFFKEALIKAIDKSQGIINQNAIKMAEQIFEGKLPFSWVLWRIINFGEWMETYQVACPALALQSQQA